ncbi:MAG: flagellar basal body protein [Pseudomonadota bacterium]|jgi:flagellar hook protein FlgE
MKAIEDIARSGIAAAQTRLRVAAGNVANAATDGFQRQAVQNTTVEGGGVVSRVVPEAVQPAIPLVQDLLAAKTARYEFQANLKMIKTSFGLIGSLFDDKA